jgi:hypothetical protein
MSLLTDREVQQLIVALMRGHDGLSVPDDVFKAETQHVVAWAEEQRVGQAMLAMALRGDLDLSIVGGEVCLRKRAVR